MSEEICDGVKMLIERMQSHPEEFEYGGRMYEYNNKVAELYEKAVKPRLWHLSDAEKKALVKAYTDMHNRLFTTGVVQTILNEPEWDANMDLPYVSPSKLMLPPSLANEARKILNQEFEKEYAKNRKSRP